MKYKYLFFIILLVLLSLGYAWYESRRPPLDWSETYSPADKIPYGTYIVFRSLQQLFPGSEFITSRLTLVEQLQALEEHTDGIYISIGRKFTPDPVEWRQLLEWVAQGNRAFMAANEFADTVLHTFSMRKLRQGDTGRSRLFYSDFEDKEYVLTGGNMFRWVTDSAFAGEVLGGRGRQEINPDFVCIPYGKGQVFLNMNPKGYSNYAVLDSVWGDYYYKTLSCLPAAGGVVVWDAYQTLGISGMHTPLRVILRYPALKMALYLLLAGGGLYLFFRARREQRPIPVVVPPQNRTLEFVSTVSLLYFKKKEHLSIAFKRIDYFLEKIRSEYLLPTEVLDSCLVKLLSERSGVSEQQTEELISLIVRIKKDKQVKEEELKKLMGDTELFIRKTKDQK